MIVKTNAIALRAVPYSETSRIVSWLTQSHGRIVSIVKGAHRPKSAFMGQFDLFYTCELVFYLKNYHGLHTVKECAPLKPRSPLRELWKSAACASYLADIASQAAPIHACHEDLFHWLDSALDALCRHDPEYGSILWFELKLMEIMGLAPMLRNCVKCGRTVPEPDPVSNAAPSEPAARYPARALLFSIRRGGVCCPTCGAGEAGDVVEVMPDAIALLRSRQNSPTWRSAECSNFDRDPFRTADNLLGLLMQYHMAVTLDSRRIAFDLLRMRFPGQNRDHPLGADVLP